jgi:RND family efflux transporter MFP subunit
MGINRRAVVAGVGLGWAAALWVSAVAAAAAGAVEAVAVPVVPVVPVMAVRAEGARSSFELEGVVQAVRQATVASQVSGSVWSLPVKAGERVKAGQVLARIDERDAQAAVQRGDAGMAQADGILRSARIAVERARELRRQGFVSQAALDLAETEFSTAQAGADQARAARNQAALQRGHATLSAPFDAIVLATHLESGDLALPGRAVATVYAPEALRVAVQVPASRAALARNAERLLVRLPDGSTVRPVRQTVMPGTDPVAQTVEVRLDLPAAAAGGLTPGQSLVVRFEGAGAATEQAAPWVPGAALLRRGELTAVYVVDGARFVLRNVRIGAGTGGDEVRVWAGLKPGEQIAADAVRAGLAGATPAR